MVMDMNKNRTYLINLLFVIIIIVFFSQLLISISLAKSQISSEPGIILIKFKEDTGIRLSEKFKLHTKDNIENINNIEIFTSKNGLVFTSLKNVLTQYNIKNVKRVFANYSEEELDNLQKNIKKKSNKKVPNLNLHYILYFDQDANLSAAVKDLNNLPFVEKAQLSYIAPPTSAVVPSDPKAIDQVNNGQWYIFRTKVNEAWTLANGSGITIADCDAGFDTNHFELNDNFDISQRYDFGDTGEPLDVDDGIYRSHGTGVVGILAAESNDVEIAGVAHEARVIPLQYFNYDGTDDVPFATGIANSVLGAISRGADVILLEAQSDGSAERYTAVRDAVITAINTGIPVVAAAGNSDNELDVEANNFTGSIIVGALGLTNERMSYSNYGLRVDVATPGTSLYTTAVSNSFTNGFGGTSGATPIVAGTVALMLDVNPELTPYEIRSIIRETATSITTDKPVGGLLNASAAVRKAIMLAGGIKHVHNINKDTNYATIQEAIDYASPGNEIHVESGTYYENVNVNKKLTLRGIGMPVVDAGGSGSAITLAADEIMLEGFTATGGGRWSNNEGINVISNNNVLRGNNASNNGCYYDDDCSGIGIHLSSSNNNTLIDNSASNNWKGIYLEYSSNNTLSGNNASSNSGYYDPFYIPGSGISLEYSSNNTLLGNTANLNDDEGISLFSSGNNMLSGNNALKNIYGIWIDSSTKNVLENNIMERNNYNFGLDGSSYSDFDNQIDTTNMVDSKSVYYIKDAINTVYDSDTNAGTFYCISCLNVTLKNLDLNSNLNGIFFWNTSKSRVQNVNASNNRLGISLTSSSNNTLIGNNANSNPPCG